MSVVQLLFSTIRTLSVWMVEELARNETKMELSPFLEGCVHVSVCVCVCYFIFSCISLRERERESVFATSFLGASL
jgi:hypothetical protein